MAAHSFPLRWRTVRPQELACCSAHQGITHQTLQLSLKLLRMLDSKREKKREGEVKEKRRRREEEEKDAHGPSWPHFSTQPSAALKAGLPTDSNQAQDKAVNAGGQHELTKIISEAVLSKKLIKLKFNKMGIYGNLLLAHSAGCKLRDTRPN